MSKILLNFGAVINLLVGALHIWMLKLIRLNEDLLKAEGMGPLMQILDISTALLVFFFAYASFFCKKDLLTTRLGKSTLVATALFYFLRALEEIVIIESNSPVVLILCALVGGMYILLLFLPYPEEDSYKENDKL